MRDTDVMQEFWTPIDISISESDATLHMCKLDFKSYHADPHLYPMFKGATEQAGQAEQPSFV
jgi:hypothetical protein